MNYKKYLRGLLIGTMCVVLMGCEQKTGALVENTELIEEVKETAETDVSVNASEIILNNEDVKINQSGDYVVRGEATETSIIIDADDKAEINLILDGVNITNENKAAILVVNAKKVKITLADGTENVLTTTKKIDEVDDIKVDGVIFAKSDLKFDGEGSLIINSEKNHGIVCKDDLKISSGNFTISAKKHGFQCKDNFVMDGGNIEVTKCDEGIEGNTITINDGTLNITSSDDGLNAAGESSSGMAADTTAWIVINGGNIYINAEGDGIDSNGDLTVNGGTVFVDGPVMGGNGALDSGGNSFIYGGTVVAVGNSSMAENFDTGSTVPSILVNVNEMVAGDVTISDTDGNVIFTYSPKKNYNSVVISHADLEVGNTYVVTMGEISNEVELTDIIYGETSGFGGFGGRPGQFKDGDFNWQDRPEGSEFDKREFDGQGKPDRGEFNGQEGFTGQEFFKPGAEQAPPERDDSSDDNVARPTVGETKDTPNKNS